MKHVVPFSIPTGINEAHIVVKKQNGTVQESIFVSAKGREVVSVHLDDLPPGVYACSLVVNDRELYKRELVIDV